MSAKKQFSALPHFKPVTQTDWLQAIGDPRCAIHFPKGGYSTVGSNWGATLRTMPEHQLYFVTQHAFDATVDGEKLTTGKGGVLWIIADAPHVLSLPAGSAGFSVHWIRVRLCAPPGQARKTEFIPSRTRSIALEEAWPLEPVFRMFSEELQRELPFRESRLRSLLSIICSHAFRAAASEGGAGPTLTAAQRRRIRELAATAVTDRLSPGDIAAELRLSHDYFTRVFRRSFGMAPRQWLMQERIRHSASRLSTSVQNVSEIAYDYGYKDVYLFSRQFKQVMGVSPLAYRRLASP